MKIAVMQPYFFPYLGYFQLIKAVDKFILYDKVAYIKKGWVNRNRIGMVNDMDRMIVVPVLNASSNKLIQEVKIDNSQNWAEKILQLIYFNYKKSSHFEEVFHVIEGLLNNEYDTIGEVNAATTIGVARFLDIPTEIIADTSDFAEMESHLEDGTYGEFFAGELVPERKTARVVEICRKEKAETYVNPIGGTELYDKDEFRTYGINLEFVKMHPVEYPQFTKEFIPGLSILDVLFHNGKEKTKLLLNEFDLV